MFPIYQDLCSCSLWTDIPVMELKYEQYSVVITLILFCRVKIKFY